MSMAVPILDEVKKWSNKSYPKMTDFDLFPEPYIPCHRNNRNQMTIQIYTVASVKCFFVCRTENTGHTRDHL